MTANEFESFDPLMESSEETASEAFQHILVREIIGSYHSNYDVFAETVQNAVDAVEERYYSLREDAGNKDEADVVFTYEPKIWVTVDLKQNEIQICDNGTGMDFETFQKSLSPAFSGKDIKKIIGKKMHFRGHKGMGLTFLAYGFNKMRLSTKTDHDTFVGEMKDGRNWVKSPDNESKPQCNPSIEPSEIFNEISTGTCVTVRCDSESRPKKLSQLARSFSEWECIFRTLTAIGYVDINGDGDEFRKRTSIELRIINTDNSEKTGNINFDYLYPHTAQGFRFLDLKKYHSEHAEQTSIPKKHRNAYDGLYRVWNRDELKNLLNDERKTYFEDLLDKYNPKVYAFFSYGQPLWKELNNRMIGEERKSDRLAAGIQIASEHMPIGEKSDAQVKYGTGNKNRIFIVSYFENARPDLGRKSFENEIGEFSQEIANLTTDHFIDNRELLKPSKERPSTHEEWKEKMAEDRIEEARKQAKDQPLLLDGLSLLSEPISEQEVVALFFELIGHRRLKSYNFLSVSGNEDQYDAVFEFEPPDDNELVDIEYSTDDPLGLDPSFTSEGLVKLNPKNCEFKFSLDGLIEDFGKPASDRGAKRFQDLRLVIAWQAGEFWKEDFVLYPCLLEDFRHMRRYHGVTHVMTRKSGSDHEIQVVLLRDIRDYLNDANAAIAFQRTEYLD